MRLRAFIVASVLLALPAIDMKLAYSASIEGLIENRGSCRGVAALLRVGRDPRRPALFLGEYDPDTGRFRIDRLPAGVFDLRILLENGWIEGANMKAERGRSVDEKMTDEDREAISDFIVNHPDQFVDIIRLLRIEGDARYARALVELIRYTPFHGGGADDRIWRVEIWDFENFHGVWARRQRGSTVLARVRTPDEMPRKQFDNLTWLFDTNLGGIELKATGEVKDFVFRIPEKPTMAMGKIPGSVESQVSEHRKMKEREAGAP